MAVIKNINVTIYKYNEQSGEAEQIFASEIVNTLLFPHAYVEKVMNLVTGWVCDEEDHNMLNNLQAHGQTGFKFGEHNGDWSHFVQAVVTYP